MRVSVRALAVAAVLGALSPAALAYSGGITGYSGNPSAVHGSGSNCTSCHGGGSFGGTPGISGASSISTNASGVAYSVTLSGSSATAAGFNLSVVGGTLTSGSGSQTLDPGTGGTFELTHTAKQFLSGSAASWSFTYAAPSTVGTQTMYVCVNQVNNDASTTGDQPTCTSKSISITNSAPTVSGWSSAAASFTEGGSAVVIDSSITITEPDADNLNRALVAISNFQTGDVLACPGCAGAGLTGSFSAGTLTITGTASAATYASVIQGVTFQNTSNNPVTTTRTITLALRDTYSNSGTSGTNASVSVTAVNDAPTIIAPGSIGVTEDAASALTGISFSDVDSGSGTLTATFSVASGTINSPGCASVTSGGTATARTLTGTTTNLNNCISGSNLLFTTASNATSTVTLGVALTDNGNTGSGGAKTAPPANVSLTVTAVNDPPSISAPASIGVTEDVPGPLTGITFSDVDAASGTLTATFTVASGTLNAPPCGGGVVVGGSATARTLAGTLTNLNSCISGGNLTFTTAANATATVTLGIALSDGGNTGSGGVQSATPANVSLTVTPVNDPPTAVADALGVSKNSSNNSLDVLANDTDPDTGDTKSLVSVGATDHGGTVTLGTGSPCAINRLCYTPATNYSGPETFSYTMQDAAGLQSSAGVTITVAAGTAPVGVADSATVLEDSVSTSIDVLANDTDADVGDTKEISQVNGLSTFPVATTNGSVSLSGTGPNNQVIYTPAANYFGSDSFTYTVKDAAGLTGLATVSITVTAVNDAPTLAAIASPAAVNEDAAAQIVNLSGISAGLPANESGQALTVTASSNNTALIPNPAVTYTSANATGSLSYTPVANASGSAIVTVTVQDNGGTANGGVDTVSRTFTVTVNPVNDVPTLNALSNANLAEDAPQQVVNLAGISAGLPANESGQTLTVTASSSNTALIPNPSVTYTSPNATGSIAYTPVANANGSAIITVTVQDSGGTANGGVDTFSRSFTVNVSAVNDPPVVAVIPDQAENDNQAFTYNVTVTDADGETSFTYSLSGAPAGMTINSSGQISWTPPVGTRGTFTPTVNAFDAALAQGSRSFNLVVSAPDSDGDGMPDSYENLYPSVLDPNNPNDANLDPDHDGRTNLQEYLAGSNPTIDDVAPVLTIPADLIVPATGYYTVVALGTATATDGHDGPITPTSSWTQPVVRPGRYDVIWSARDLAGNTATATQHVDVLPLADFSADQVSGEGQTRSVTVTLNGDAPGCPAVNPSVSYTVGGTATSADHDAVSGTLQISCASLTGTIPVNIVADAQTEPVETVIFSITAASGAVAGTHATVVLRITDTNAPPQVVLAAFQGAYPRLTAYQGDGTFTVAATAADPNGDALTYNWGGSAAALGIAAVTASSVSFDPSTLAAGSYAVRLLVSDGGGSGSASLLVTVVAGSSTRVDVDADGVPDDVDTVLDYPAVLDNQTGDPASSLLLETEPGLALTLGRTALAAGRSGALISLSDLVTYGVGAGGIALGADSRDNVGGLFDFEIHGLAPGASARVVLPLQTALRAGAVYRKFTPAAGWHDFISDANNAVASAASAYGQCPGPASTQYVSGLQPFADCVRLTLQDGGPDDADGVADGVIRDPGGAAVASGGAVAATPAFDGGAFAPYSMLGLLALALLRRARRALSVVLLAVLACARPAQAAPLRYSGELSSGFDTNVTNAAAERDVRETGLVSGSLSASSMRELNLYTTLELRGTAMAEYSSSFSELSNGKLSGLARVLYRPNGDFFTPLLAASFSAAYWEFGSDIRDSNEYRFGVFARRNITTQISGRLTLDYAIRDSASRVFDTRGGSVGLNFDWMPVHGITIYGGYQYYRGDIVSTATTPGDFNIILAAKVIEADDAFGGFGANQLAYRLEAQSNIGTLGVNVPFSQRWSADLQGRYIDTHADRGIGYTRALGVLSLLARL